MGNDLKLSSDARSAMTVLRQWEKLEQIRRCLVKRGLVDEDASAEEVIEVMRKAVPPTLFGDVRPPVH